MEEVMLKVNGFGVRRHLQHYVSYTMGISFIGGGNRNTLGKPPNCDKSLTNLYRVHLTMIS
jgi:hypothetical protein